MGKMAEDMVSGACCSWCGVYFEKEHGYPVVCSSCAEGYTDKDLEGMSISRAITQEVAPDIDF